MAASPCNLFLFMISVVSIISTGSGHASDPRSTYIIHVHLPQISKSLSLDSSSVTDIINAYKSFLPAEPETSEGEHESRLVFPYFNVFTGFAARLSEEELQAVKNKAGFLHAYPDRVLTLQTTHSPSFLGLSRNGAGLWNDSAYGKGVIVGVLDSGVMPDHPSFNDKDMPPPPAKWKGACEFNTSLCNNKIIGAKDFTGGSQLGRGPYDTEGHGTHTASTIAGSFVDNANFNGLANGTASGIAPYAHLAIYKVCFMLIGCPTSAILAGMDAAIEDGVDVISLSLGGQSVPFYNDSVAIGAMGAIQKGILVSCAAGNAGPEYEKLSNEAPWILTVGASTMDRQIRTTVTLGNNDEFNGESAYQPSSYVATAKPLVYPGATGGSRASTCLADSLDSIDVKGKIVACLNGVISRDAKVEIVKKAGGVGTILLNTQQRGSTTVVAVDEIPTSNVKYKDGLSILGYANSSHNPTASISFKGTALNVSPAPELAAFSSRGPNHADPNILKPDIIGPGVNILAAWPFTTETNSSKFNIISGTSMATPHLSGIMALLKSIHPDWSPAAIKSAIMTTASSNANDKNPIVDQSTDRAADLFGIGAGHVVPSRAKNPGLVYDTKYNDYLKYLCGLGYTDKQVSVVAHSSVKCSDIGSISPGDLNYPSFSVLLNLLNKKKTQVTRTVMNVGAATSSYTVHVNCDFDAVTVDVVPKKISFTKVNEEIKYNVTFTYNGGSNVDKKIIAASLTWVSDDDATVTVRSPIMISVTP